ncbi:hypothetical protein [Arthrobacter sp. fls2-241-R2A-172]|uniref:hypothetical protein n=1 Tax=Arthrobacter sp. fls2-241-R2A-172 TaxID=3040325 RepID=UPI002550CCF6|nr:hypothetical protein [Arthrobacter sp. fls2-241-R2A-172]
MAPSEALFTDYADKYHGGSRWRAARLNLKTPPSRAVTPPRTWAAPRVQTTIRPWSAPERKVRGAGQMSTELAIIEEPGLSALGV